jgi:hypothetical protein
LSTENYGGPNWAAVHDPAEAFDPDRRQHVGHSSAADGATYVIAKDSTGALKVSHSTINVISAAASVAVGGGLVAWPSAARAPSPRTSS